MPRGVYPRGSWQERVPKRVTQSPEGCLLWQGARTSAGYPVMSVGGNRNTRVTRLVLEAKLGRPIRPGYCACHTCDTPACVNEAHLYEGDRKDNAKDAVDRGQLPKGLDHYRAKLTPEAVKKIRKAYKQMCTEMGAQLGVSQSAVKDVIQNRSWKHIRWAE